MVSEDGDELATMTLFASAPGLIRRTPQAVMQTTCADDISEIQRLWSWFEGRVGLRGRKMFGTADVLTNTYTTCTLLREGDDPAGLGLEVGELPGGTFLRGRLLGPAPEVYASIGPGFQELESTDTVDRTRPLVEYYRRANEVELWLPIIA